MAGGGATARLPAAVALLDEVVDQFAGGVIHFNVEGLHAVGEVVKEPDSRDGHKKAERGGDQGFRDTAGDRTDTGGLLRGDFLKGLEDAGDGSEQADEGSGGTDGSQRAQASLQLGVNDRFGPLESALGRFNLLHTHCTAAAVVAELLQTSGDDFRQMRFLVAVGNFDGFVQLAFLEGSGNARGKLTGLFAGGVEIEVAVDHNGEGPDGHDEQNEHDAAGKPAHVVPEVDRTESDRLAFLKEAEGRRVGN